MALTGCVLFGGAILGFLLVPKWFRNTADLFWMCQLETKRVAIVIGVLSLLIILISALLLGRGPNGQVPLQTIIVTLVILLPLLGRQLIDLWAYQASQRALVENKPRFGATPDKAEKSGGQDQVTDGAATTSHAGETLLTRLRALSFKDAKGFVFKRAEAEQRKNYSAPPYAALSAEELAG